MRRHTCDHDTPIASTAAKQISEIHVITDTDFDSSRPISNSSQMMAPSTIAASVTPSVPSAPGGDPEYRPTDQQYAYQKQMQRPEYAGAYCRRDPVVGRMATRVVGQHDQQLRGNEAPQKTERREAAG